MALNGFSFPWHCTDRVSIPDIAAYVIAAKSPTRLVYADLFESRTVESYIKSPEGMHESCVAALQISLFFAIAKMLVANDTTDITVGLAALEEAAHHTGMGGELVWKLVDEKVVESCEKLRKQQVAVGAALLNTHRRNDELWQRFWQLYRKRDMVCAVPRPGVMGSTTNVAVRHGNDHDLGSGSQSEPLSRSAATATSRLAARSATRASRHSSNILQLPSAVPSRAATASASVRTSATRATILPAAKTRSSRPPTVSNISTPIASKIRSGYPRVDAVKAHVSECSGLSRVCQSIMREYQGFEELARQHHMSKEDDVGVFSRSPGSVTPREALSSRSEGFSTHAMHQSEATDSHGGVQEVTGKPKLINKAATMESLDRSCVGHRGVVERRGHGCDLGGGFEPIEDLSNHRTDDDRHEPVYCYSNFDDYKKRQTSPRALKADKNTRAVLEVQSRDPMWQWSNAVREHKIASSWRLRGEFNDPSDTLDTPRFRLRASEAAALESKDPHKPPIVGQDRMPTASIVNFHRPWSREFKCGEETPFSSRRRPITGSGAGGDVNGMECAQDSQDSFTAAALDPLQRYAKVCVTTGVYPQYFSVAFLAHRPPILSLRGADYSDEDVLALTASLPYDSVIESADFGENPRLTDVPMAAMINALGEKHAQHLHCLRFDHCHRLGKDTLCLVVKLLQTRFHEMQVIDLSGMTIGRQEYKLLAVAIECHLRLVDVRLAATDLGIGDKGLASQVVAHLMGNRRLAAIDFGWNSLDVAAFETLGRCLMEHRCMRSLCLASTAACVDVAIGGSPVTVFLELLAGDATLTSLDISNNSLDGSAVMVLESAVIASGHPKLETIAISDNRLGIDGIRSLLRMLAHPQCPELRHVVMENCNGIPLAGHFNGPYEGDPSGDHTLNMSYPSHRALLRLLLMRLSGAGNGGFATCTRGAQLRRADVVTPFSFDGLKRGKNASWDVPTAGMLTFQLCAEEPVLANALKEGLGEPTRVVEQMIMQSRMVLNRDWKVMTVLTFVKGMQNDAIRASLLDAIGRDFALSIEQVLALSCTGIRINNSGKDPANTCSSLLCSVISLKSIRSVVECTNGLGELMLLEQKARWLLNLDLDNPTRHYDLNMNVPSDRCTCERLLLLNRWQYRLWREKGRVDISEFGNGKNFRNVTINGKAFVFSGNDWSVPTDSDGGGRVSFDYIALSRPPKDAVPVEDVIWQDILAKLREIICHEKSIEPQATATPRPVRSTGSNPKAHASKRTQKRNAAREVSSVRVAPREDTTKELTCSRGKKDGKLRLDEADVLWGFLAASSKFWIISSQLRELMCLFYRSDVRVNAVVSLLLRTIDWPTNGKLCRPKFSHESWNGIRERVGFVTMFLAMQPEHTCYLIDLAVPEQRRTLHALVRLNQAEHSTNLKKARVDWKGPRSMPTWETFVSGVPLSWDAYDAIPTQGVFEATYTCSMENVKLRVRRRIAGPALAGWVTLPEETNELTQLVCWWAVLDEVPCDVVRTLVFIVSRWSSITEGFHACDSNGDGQLNHKEFVTQLLHFGFGKPVRKESRDKSKEQKDADKSAAASAETDVKPSLPPGPKPKMPAKRTQGPGTVILDKSPVADDKEQDHHQTLTVVYRFLDTTNDGDISKKEFQVFEAVWRELWQSTYELKLHLVECCGSLQKAWDLGDKEERGFLTYSDFLQLARDLCFDGPIRAIFMYLDGDSDERIGEEEWRILDDVGTVVKKPRW